MSIVPEPIVLLLKSELLLRPAVALSSSLSVLCVGVLPLTFSTVFTRNLVKSVEMLSIMLSVLPVMMLMMFDGANVDDDGCCCWDW